MDFLHVIHLSGLAFKWEHYLCENTDRDIKLSKKLIRNERIVKSKMLNMGY